MGKVYVLGVGLVSALGSDSDSNWTRLLGGVSGLAEASNFDASSLDSRIVGEVADLQVMDHYPDRRTVRNATVNDQLAIVAGGEAVRDAGLDLDALDLDRCGLFLASSKEVSDPQKVMDIVLTARNPDGTADVAVMGANGQSMYPLFYVEGLQAASLFYLSKMLGFRGPNTYFAGTAESGLIALGQARQSILHGDASLCLAGGFDDGASWWSASRMALTGQLSTNNDDPASAVRPFDESRDGFALADGAALLLLGSADSATACTGSPYGVLSGFASGLSLSSDSDSVASALELGISRALEDAEVAADEVDLIVAHGDATDRDDVEAAAIDAVFGDLKPAVTAIKQSYGHTVGGAGAANLAVAALCVREQQVPPIQNLRNPFGVASKLDLVTEHRPQLRIRNAVAIGLGDGGEFAVGVVSNIDVGRG